MRIILNVDIIMESDSEQDAMEELAVYLDTLTDSEHSSIESFVINYSDEIYNN